MSALHTLTAKQVDLVMKGMFMNIPLEDYPYFDGSFRTAIKPISMSRQRPSELVDPNEPIATGVFELTVTSSLCNCIEAFHGGAVALTFDMCTSAVIIASTVEEDDVVAVMVDGSVGSKRVANDAGGSGHPGPNRPPPTPALGPTPIDPEAEKARQRWLKILDIWSAGHVTRTLNCTYIRPAPVGTRLRVECEVAHLGRSIGLTKGVIRRASDGAVCYTCEHQKVAQPSAGVRL